MKRKLLVLDIDGTLVNSKKVITPKTLEALLKVQEQGHMIALASGRPYPGLKPFVKQLKLEEYGGYALSFNGGKVVSCATGESVYEETVPNRYAKIIYDYAIEHGLGLVTYDSQNVITGTEIDHYMEYEAKLNGMELVKVDDFVSYVDFDMTKCLLTAEPLHAAACELEMRKLLAPKLNVFRSEPYFIEITNCNVDKAKSIAGLLEIIGMKQEDTVCCGDGFNDLSMVSYGGIGVAMGNAQEIVKQNADFITGSCDEDGLVTVIEKFF